MDSTGEFDAIVVGAGLAGLTCAAFLSSWGYTVLVCERSERTGGLVGSFVDRGFTFDSGIRAFENSGIVFPMLRQLEVDLPCVSNPVTIGIGEDTVRVVSPDSLSEYARLLQRIFPENAADIDRIVLETRKVMEYMDVLYGIDNPLFMDIAREGSRYVFRTLLPWLIRYQRQIGQIMRLSEPVEDYLRRFTSNRALIDMITQHFFGATPAFFALSYFGLYLDYSYPLGGTGVLAAKMTRAVEERGGRILLSTEVAGVDLAAKTVRSADGRAYRYRRLIWAGDSRALYRAVDVETIADSRQRARAMQQRELALTAHGNDSVLSVFMAVDLPPEYFEARCGAHMFYTPSTRGLSTVDLGRWGEAGPGPTALPGADREAQLELVGEFLAATTFEISCPALRDRNLAPEGQTGLIVSTLFDYDIVTQVQDAGWYEQFKDFCQQKVVEILDASLFQGLHDKLLFAHCSTPLTLERATGNTHGAITGWAFTNPQVPAESRFRQVALSVNTPLPDVYQAGQWSFSPSGLPISILTGRLAADRVKRDLRKRGSRALRTP